jgi:rubrerythrin
MLYFFYRFVINETDEYQAANPKHRDIYNFLASYEHCCALFYRRKAEFASKEEQPGLAAELVAIAEWEMRHAQIWWQLAGRKNHPTVQTLREHPEYGSINNVDSDGISRRYLAGRFFFKNKFAKDYDWENTLAFSIVGEEVESLVYRILSWACDPDLREYSQVITQEEFAHNQRLVKLLNQAGKFKRFRLVCYWRIRAAIAGLIFVLLDAPKMLTR